MTDIEGFVYGNIDTTGATLICPRGDGKGVPVVINLEKVLKSQIRLDEVATLTMQKAPELLTVFNKNWLYLHETVVVLTSEKNKAERALKKRASTVALELTAKVLKDKGVSSTADSREAVLFADEEYQAILERVDYIKSLIEYLKGKAQAFENAWSSVKKIMSEDGYALGFIKPDISGGMCESADPVFGRPLYDL
jgi:hypothetical protein